MKRLLCALLALLLLFSEAAMAATQREKADKLPYWIEVDIKNQLTIVHSTADNAVVRTMICSTGLRSGMTPKGTFYMPAKKYSTERGPWHAMMGGVYARYATRIRNKIMFHSILYSRKKVNTLQRVSWKKLGQQASHGCIRLTPIDAQWIAYNCGENTRVVIHSGGGDKERRAQKDAIKSSLPGAKSDGTLGVWEPTLSPTPTPEQDVKLGSSGVQVTNVQKRLKELGFYSGKATGKFDASLETAVKRFEGAMGLQKTGIATIALQRQIHASSAPTGQYVKLKKGDKGPAVKAMQTWLKDLGFFSGTANGTFSATTVKAVRAFYKSVKQKVRDDATTGMQRLLKERAQAHAQAS